MDLMQSVRLAVQSDRIQILESELIEARVSADKWQGAAERLARIVEQYRDESEPETPPAPDPKPTYQRRPIPPLTRLMVFARDNWQCLHCGATDQLHIDHINPVSNGGGNEYENLQVLCKPCNSRKGFRPPETMNILDTAGKGTANE